LTLSAWERHPLQGQSTASFVLFFCSKLPWCKKTKRVRLSVIGFVKQMDFFIVRTRAGNGMGHTSDHVVRDQCVSWRHCLPEKLSTSCHENSPLDLWHDLRIFEWKWGVIGLLIKRLFWNFEKKKKSLTEFIFNWMDERFQERHLGELSQASSSTLQLQPSWAGLQQPTLDQKLNKFVFIKRYRWRWWTDAIVVKEFLWFSSKLIGCKSVLVPPDHLLLDSVPNIVPLISR
jgi:hypothetical protein